MADPGRPVYSVLRPLRRDNCIKLSVLALVPGSLSSRHTSLIRSNGTQRPTFWVHQQAAPVIAQAGTSIA